jgi:excinuclease ABC subunit A
MSSLHLCKINSLFLLLRDCDATLIIECHPDVIKQSDWIIDLGPEGGGRIVAQGTPEQVAKVRKSYTGQVLARVLGGNGNHG